MKTKTILEGCGIGILFTMSYLWVVLSPYRPVFYHSLLPFNSIVWGLFLDLAIISLLAAFLLLYFKRRGTFGRRLFWALVIARLASLLAYVVDSLWLWPLRPMTVSIVMLAGALGLWWLRPGVYETIIEGTQFVCRLIGWSIFWVIPELLFLGLHKVPAGPESIVAGRAIHTPQDLPSAGEKRIVWLLFDELSQDQTFDHRFPGLAMPAFDKLKSESILFHDVTPVGFNTDRVIPSLFLGRTIGKIESDLRGMPRLQFASQRRWRHFDEQSTLFGEAKREGWTTGVVGWYNPYCRLLAGTLDYCYWRVQDDLSLWASPSPQNSIVKNAVAPVMAKIEELDHKPENVLQTRENEVSWITSQGLALIRDEKIRFLFIHLPVPHPPATYDRQTGQFRTGGSYIDNLALSDQLLAEFIAALKATPSFEKTTLIVSSDHSWRISLWRSGSDWTQEDDTASHGKFDPRPVLMIHYPGQTNEMDEVQPFPEIKLHFILEAMLQGKLQSPAGVENWLKQDGQRQNAAIPKIAGGS